MRRVRPRVVSLGNLFRDQLDRYGELEHIADRWRAAVAALPPHVDADRQRGRPARRRSRRRARRGRFASASTILGSPGPRSSMRPTRSTASVAARPYAYAAAYVGTSRRLPLPCLWPRAAGARRRGAIDRSAGARRVDLRSRHPGGNDQRCVFPSPASTTSTTPSPRPPSRSRSTRRSTRSRAGLGTFTAAFGRFERIEAGDRRILMLLIKNPAGANEAIRTLEEGGVPANARDRPERPHRRRSRRLVDLGRRLRAAARSGRADRRQRRACGRAGPAVHLRGLPAGAAGGDPRSPRGARSRARARPRRRRARRASDLHGDARRCGRSPSPAASCDRTGRRRNEDRRRAPLPGLPQHLCRPGQHRRARPARGAARPRARR